MEKFARKCNATSQGMNEGYVVFDGALYFSTEKDLIKYLRILDWEDCDGNRSEDIEDDKDLLDYFYRENVYYWTDWYDDDSDWAYYEDENGNIVEL